MDRNHRGGSPWRTAVAVTAAVAATLTASWAWSVTAAPGDADATFVPITPCRLADTRPGDNRVGTQGAFSPGDTKTFAARGTNGKCTIPADATALSLNVTALGASQLTFLTFWPGGTRPVASSLNPAPGEPPTPNAVTTTLAGDGSFKVYNEVGTVNTIIDINGYYTKGSLKSLEARVAALEKSRPFVASAYAPDDGVEVVSSAVVVSLAMTAPAAGKITVNSSAVAIETEPEGLVACSINELNSSPDPSPAVWESAGFVGAIATLAGTRTFSVTAGQTLSLVLFCSTTDVSTFVSNAVLTATFTS